MNKAKYKIGVDLGGTKIEAILAKDNILKPIIRKRIPTNQKEGYAAIIKKIVGLINELKETLPKTVSAETDISIGLCMPGFVYPRTSIVANSNTQCLNDKPFKKDLEKQLGQSVAIENDANCFALSEACWGAAQGSDLVLGIIIGTGMGGGLIYKKNIISGFHGYAGEIGHISFNLKGEKCWCGNFGCSELYLSGSGIQNQFKKLFKLQLTVQEIYNLYLKKDSKALRFMNIFLDSFGQILANLIYLICPDKIVLGGGVSKLPILYSEGFISIKKYLKHNKFTPRISS